MALRDMQRVAKFVAWFVRGARGHAPPRKIFKNGPIWCVLENILLKFCKKKKIVKDFIFYIKIIDNVLLRTLYLGVLEYIYSPDFLSIVQFGVFWGTFSVNFFLTHERPVQYICCKECTYTLQHTYLIQFYNMLVSVFYIYNWTYIQKEIYYSTLYHCPTYMSEHILKSELFCNKRNTLKSSTLDQHISILEMSCEYKKNMWI